MALNTPPQKQKIYTYSTYSATQRGEVVGYRAYPQVPNAIFPNALMKAPVIERQSPRRRGNGYEEFPVSYTYEFQSATPLVGKPNVWVN
jgi:hypothetical protein